MDEQNPLEISPKLVKLPPVNNNKISNKRGRPTIKNIVKFGPQPKSIIAQMLSDMKTENCIVIEDESINENGPSRDIDDKIEEHECQTCSHRSTNYMEHKKHLSSHQQFLCDFPKCNYSCKLSSNLIKHKRVHTNEKPYLCDRCSFRTNFVNSLKAHKRTHTAEKPYQCKHCSYKCNSSSNLKKHCHLRHPEGNKCKYK